MCISFAAEWEMFWRFLICNFPRDVSEDGGVVEASSCLLSDLIAGCFKVGSGKLDAFN